MTPKVRALVTMALVPLLFSCTKSSLTKEKSHIIPENHVVEIWDEILNPTAFSASMQQGDMPRHTTKVRTPQPIKDRIQPIIRQAPLDASEAPNVPGTPLQRIFPFVTDQQASHYFAIMIALDVMYMAHLAASRLENRIRPTAADYRKGRRPQFDGHRTQRRRAKFFLSKQS